MTQEYLIYADESDKAGQYYSNFFGGLLVRSEHIDDVRSQLKQAKEKQNLFQEIKWSKVTAQYLEKYLSVVDTFFNLVEADRIKVRIMFTQNARVPLGLTAYQQRHGYHLLYYQFFKHAFGLAHCDNGSGAVYLRFFIDNMPHSKERNEQFKGYLMGLQNAPEFRRKQIRIRREAITEVSSHDHDLLQYLDIVLGAMQFRLNDKHKEKPAGERQRGSRTIAKEKLYKHILHRVRQIYPNFNIGISTGMQGDQAHCWRHPYRHWLFTPSDYQLDTSRTKK